MQAGWLAIALFGATAAAAAPSSTSPGQTVPPDVVVKAVPTPVDTRQKGVWRRAESSHVVVFSKGGVAELTRVSGDLESLYRLMSRLYRRGDRGDRTAKLQVTLIDAKSSLRAMGLAGAWAAGPYQAAFADQPYYDPRGTGDVIAVARDDQIVDLNTNRAYNLDCDDAMAEGATECTNNVPYHDPAVRTWQAMLYATYARRFLMTYVPAIYPRWYLDSVAALFSTVRLRDHGMIDYATPPDNYRQVFRSFGDVRVGDVLAGRSLAGAPDTRSPWTPYHAWLLGHYFLYSNLKPDRTRQFQHYMASVAQGTPLAEAASAFDNPVTLQRDVVGYVMANKYYARTGRVAEVPEAPVITLLSPGESALVEARVELTARTTALADDAARVAWLARVRSVAAAYPDDPDVLTFAAEAECRTGHPAECLSDANRALGRSHDDVGALAWRGVALTDRAIAAAPAVRTSMLEAARQSLVQAIALDSEAPLPRIAYFESFTKAGEPVPEPVMTGMATAIRANPVAPVPRLLLARELARRGDDVLARRVIEIILDGPYDPPEKTAAAALFTNR